MKSLASELYLIKIIFIIKKHRNDLHAVPDLPSSILHLKCMIIQAQYSFSIIHSWYKHHERGIGHNEI